MNPTPDNVLSCSVTGAAPRRSADPDSRLGCRQPAFFSRPRPAERAHGTNSLALQLAFDSFREPAPAGLRGRPSGERHLVYMSRDYAVDVHLEERPREGSVLWGELFSRSDGPVPEIPTFLLEGDEIAGYACTGALGEFRLEADRGADLRLCLLLDAERCIDLPIDLSPAATAASGG